MQKQMAFELFKKFNNFKLYQNLNQIYLETTQIHLQKLSWLCCLSLFSSNAAHSSKMNSDHLLLQTPRQRRGGGRLRRFVTPHPSNKGESKKRSRQSIVFPHVRHAGTIFSQGLQLRILLEITQFHLHKSVLGAGIIRNAGIIRGRALYEEIRQVQGISKQRLICNSALVSIQASIFAGYLDPTCS